MLKTIQEAVNMNRLEYAILSAVLLTALTVFLYHTGYERGVKDGMAEGARIERQKLTTSFCILDPDHGAVEFKPTTTAFKLGTMFLMAETSIDEVRTVLSDVVTSCEALKKEGSK